MSSIHSNRGMLNLPVKPEVDRYKSLALIGEGGFGSVWLVREKLTGAYFALKLIRQEGIRELDGLQRYRTARELRTCPHLAQIYDAGETPDGFYYTMELADNLEAAGISERYAPDTLSARISSAGRLRYDEIIWYLFRLLDGVEALHRAGLAHSDIKPSNIIFIGGEPKLADIGLVTVASDTGSGGTPGYTLPAASDRNSPATARSSDYYALGMVILNMLGAKSLEEPLEDLTQEEKRLRDFGYEICHPGGIPTSDSFRAGLQKHSLRRPAEVSPRPQSRLASLVRRPWIAACAVLLFALAGLESYRYFDEYRQNQQYAKASEEAIKELRASTAKTLGNLQELSDSLKSTKGRLPQSSDPLTEKSAKDFDDRFPGERKSEPGTRINSYFSPDGGAQKAILREIGKTVRRIQVAVYFFTEEEFADALIAAKKRGAVVEVLVDKTQENRKDSMVPRLIAAGIPVYIDEAHRIMHDKFAVIDSDTVITGSQNWTDSSDKKNAENTLIIRNNRHLAQKYREMFEKLKVQAKAVAAP